MSCGVKTRNSKCFALKTKDAVELKTCTLRGFIFRDILYLTWDLVILILEFDYVTCKSAIITKLQVRALCNFHVLVSQLSLRWTLLGPVPTV